MKKLLLAVLTCSALFAACSSGKAPGTTVNGNYLFDTDALKTALKGSGDQMMANMPDDVLQQVIDGMKGFHIELNETQATATFGETVVKGILSKTGEAGGEMKFLMTPVDEDKKKDTVTLIVKGETLMLDPGKKDIDKMYFKKEVPAAK